MRFRLKKWMTKLLFMFIAIGIFSLLAIYVVAFLLGPPELKGHQTTIIYDNTGEIIGKEHGLQTKEWLSLDEISPTLIEATLLIEDQNFYDHHGFDYKRIVAAVLKNISSASLKEGASTLSQQYARNLYLSPEKTWTRKISEAFYTIRLEMFLSKEEILEGYLNTIYYGHGAYGVEAASNYFFNKSANDLTVAEASMLAGIPKGPTYYSPLNDEENANDRQQLILNKMLDEDAISKQEYAKASAEKLVYSSSDEETELASFFQDEVVVEASKLLDIELDEIRSGGYHIYTTLNRDLQYKMESAIDQQIDPQSEVETAAITMDPSTGAILAMMGGRDYKQSTYNRAMDARRMPGSTFKPFLYYTALEHGYTASTKLMSTPTTFELENGQVYQPSNFNGYYAHEPITLASAIALSDNVYAVKTNMFLGPEKLVQSAEHFGLTGEFPAVPSLALGTASVTVEEMTAAYGMLANGGERISGYTVEKIIDGNGKKVFEKETDNGKQVLDPKKTFILTHLMSGMFDQEMNGYTSVTGSSIADELTGYYAGKSGTTNSDSWMIGYSPSLVTGVWTGYDDNRAMEVVAESSYSKEVWAAFMEAAHDGKNSGDFSMPAGVVGIPIDPVTGKRATPACEKSRMMYFEKGTEPEGYCTEDNQKESETEDDKGILERWFDLFF